MATARTGAERYLLNRRADPEYERAYNATRQRIDRSIGILDGWAAAVEATTLARSTGCEVGEGSDGGSSNCE